MKKQIKLILGIEAKYSLESLDDQNMIIGVVMNFKTAIERKKWVDVNPELRASILAANPLVKLYAKEYLEMVNKEPLTSERVEEPVEEYVCREEINTLILRLYKKAKYFPRDELTFCNVFVSDIVKAYFGSDALKGKLANDIVDVLSTECKTLKNADACIREVKKGNIVIAGQKLEGHGHVCPCLSLRQPEWSGNYSGMVPHCANVGGVNFIKKVSYAFRTLPVYYLITKETFDV